MRRLAAYLVAAALWGGCVAAAGPTTPKPQCGIDFQCRADEMCAADGQCYGAPATTDGLAAEVIPPNNSAYIRQEWRMLPVVGGEIQLMLSKPVTLTGHVFVTGTTTGVAAKVIAQRASDIPGRPDYVVEATASSDGRFTMALPVVVAPATWQFVVYPPAATAIGGDGPPVPFLVDMMADRSFDFTLPGPTQLKRAHGVVVDAAGRPVPAVSVQVWGKLSVLGTDVLASDTQTTGTDGSFTVTLPTKLHSDYRLVVNPGQGAKDMPEVSLPGLSIPDPTSITVVRELGSQTLPPFSKPQHFSYRVHGTTGAGADAGAMGAQLILTTAWSDFQGGTLNPCAANGPCASFQAEGVADATGMVTVDLLPGTSQLSRPYQGLVLTTADSPFAGTSGLTLQVASTGGVGEDIPLDRKVTLTGHILDSTGTPIGGVQVFARPSATFRAALTSSYEQTVLAAVQPPSYVVPNVPMPDGLFVLPVEPSLLGRGASYDLEIVPPLSSLVPRWTITGINVDTGMLDPSRTMDVGDQRAPESTTVRGQVLDPSGAQIYGAQILIYQVGQTLTACLAGNTCTVPARLLYLSVSDPAAIPGGGFSAVLANVLSPQQ